jgi:hypothetical protein
MLMARWCPPNCSIHGRADGGHTQEGEVVLVFAERHASAASAGSLAKDLVAVHDLADLPVAVRD